MTGARAWGRTWADVRRHHVPDLGCPDRRRAGLGLLDRCLLPLRDLPRGQMSWDTADIYRRQYRAPGWIASALQQPDQEGLRRSGRRVLVPKVTISDLTGDRRILQFGFNVVLSAFPKEGRSGADP